MSSPGARPAVTKAPLTKRMRPGHWMAIDCAVGAIAAVLAMFVLSHSLSTPPRILAPAAFVLTAIVFFPVALRRRGPIVAYGVLIAAAVVVAGAGAATSIVVFLAAAYVLYLVTATSNRQSGAAALALALAAIGLIVVADKQLRGAGAGYVPVVFAEVIAWMTGYSVRQRRLYAQTLQHQAASSAVAEERLRIARELHDVVAHSMSVIAVQAGYGQYVIDTSPTDAKDALGAIQATSRDALEEMRRMLGVLRHQDADVPGAGGAGRRASPPPLAPAPGLSDLDRLIQRTCGAGVQVTLDRSGLVRAMPAGIDMSAYRIIQEALTNVVKHAGGGAYCSVTLRYGESVLDIQVTDDGGRSPVLAGAAVGGSPGTFARASAGAPPEGFGGAGALPVGALPARGAGGAGGAGGVGGAGGAGGVGGVGGVGGATGHGIIGMRERANLCGGAFSARPLPAGGFQVTVTLPLLGGPPEAGGAGEADPGVFDWDAPGDFGGTG
jgi:signal transduction histidine kinase